MLPLEEKGIKGYSLAQQKKEQAAESLDNLGI